MKQEDKDLLLRYLSMALPYNVAAKADYETDPRHHNLHNYTVAISGYVDGINQFESERVQVNVSGFTCELNGVKPYLRPLSSMTEEEINEFILISDTVLWLGNKRSTCILSIEQMNWLNAHHFDFLGLIPRDLAIAVTEENNPYKTTEE